MSFFSKILGKNSRTGNGPSSGMSILATLEKTGAKFEAHRCGTCGATFMSSSLGLCLYSPEIDHFSLDVGGYCPVCRLYCCSLHSSLSVVENEFKNAVAGSSGLGPWGVGCKRCGTALLQNDDKAPASTKTPDTGSADVHGRTGFGIKEYLRALRQLDNQSASRFLADSPNVALLLEVLRREETIDFSAVEKERQSLIKILAERLNDQDLNGLVECSKDFKDGKLSASAYYMSLRSICQKNKVLFDRYKNLKIYVDYFSDYEKVDKKALQEEFGRL